MTSYVEMCAWLDAGKLRRAHYVWGDEYRLIENLVSRLRSRPLVGEYLSITATGKNDGEIWSALNQFPAVAERPRKGARGTDKLVRHVTVRDAHLIKNFGPLDQWQRKMKPVTVLFVGSDTDFDGPVWGKAHRCPRGHSLDGDNASVVVNLARREVRYCAECRRVRKFFVERGRIVACARPRTTHQQKEAVDAVAELAKSSRGMAVALLEACEWSMSQALEVWTKIDLLGKPLSELAIEACTISNPGGDFVGALRRGHRARAATVAPWVDPDSVPRIFSECERWIGQVQRGGSAVRAGRSTAEIVRLLEVGWADAELLQRGAGRYSPSSLARATEALGAADTAWYRDRGRVGVLELLALSW